MSEAENSTLIEMTADLIAALSHKEPCPIGRAARVTSTVHASLPGMGGAAEAARRGP